jgi:hypothetical protein
MKPDCLSNGLQSTSISIEGVALQLPSKRLTRRFLVVLRRLVLGKCDRALNSRAVVEFAAFSSGFELFEVVEYKIKDRQ